MSNRRADGEVDGPFNSLHELVFAHLYTYAVARERMVEEALAAGAATRLGHDVVLHHHGPDECWGDWCCLHKPSKHNLSEAPLRWNDNQRLMERLCPHGLGHPDPDGLAAERRIGRDPVAAHDCDGCCDRPVDAREGFDRPPGHLVLLLLILVLCGPERIYRRALELLRVLRGDPTPPLPPNSHLPPT